VIRVGYIAGEPTPYRVPHLRLLADVDDIDLTVIYAAPTVQRRTWTLDAGDAVVLHGPRLPATFVLHHDYPLTPQIWRLLEREQFDCLVIGGWSLMATQLAIVWVRTRRVPYLLVSENHELEPRPAWVRAVKSLVLRHVIPQAAGHLVTGRLSRAHQVAYGARPDRIALWPNTIDVAALARRADHLHARRDELRRKFGVADGAVCVLQVARLIPQKAPEVLLEAVSRAGDLATTPLHVLLVGDGELKESLRIAAERLALPLTLTGTLDGNDLVGAYAAADVFALLSRREPWGVVVNEAMACGLPLVLTDRVGAAADLLVPDENGALVPAEDVEAASRAIAMLADDPELRRSFGARSRELVASWGYEGSVEAVAELVRRVVTDARSHQRTSRSAIR
jgi:glycosyltransferase involved in cell wall biosynthesis